MRPRFEIDSGIVTDPDRVREIYARVERCGACLPAFCTENRWTTESIIFSAHELAKELGLKEVPVIISSTAHYEPREQLPDYVGLLERSDFSVDPAIVGLNALIADIAILTNREFGPYPDVIVMPHLDHSHPERDRAVRDYAVERGLFATIMYDCSHLPLEENIRLTKRFVEETRGRTLVEGAVDEIYEAGSDVVKNEPTDPAEAKRFVDETGVFLIVVNVGTEHRATQRDYKAVYLGDRAREISSLVGRRLVLHGTSCLGEKFDMLKDDGFIKVNIWTKLEKDGAKALARYLDENRDGIAGPKQDLNRFPVNRFRDAWEEEVRALMKRYMLAFGYANLKEG